MRLFFCCKLPFDDINFYLEGSEGHARKSKQEMFYYTPLGDENGDIRRKADGVIELVIKPVLSDIGFSEIYAAHQISTSGSINRQVINAIVNDDLVVVNLTGLNPNVMYELAIRHVTKKPIVHIAENGTRLPFDIIDQRTIFYNNDMYGVNELKISFSKAVNACLNVENKDNPIYNAVEDNFVIEQLSDSNNRIREKAIDYFRRRPKECLTKDFYRQVYNDDTDYINRIIKINEILFELESHEILHNIKYDASTIETKMWRYIGI